MAHSTRFAVTAQGDTRRGGAGTGSSTRERALAPELTMACGHNTGAHSAHTSKGPARFPQNRQFIIFTAPSSTAENIC
jgi:hypothetical protein